jgi:hypothetical protein
MFNEQILKSLINRFGRDIVISYCKAESYKNSLLHEDCMKLENPPDCVEFSYERDWWSDAAYKLEVYGVYWTGDKKPIVES